MMNKKEFIDFMADRLDITKKQAGIELENVIGSLVDACAAGDGIKLTSELTLTVKDVPACVRTNPQDPTQKINVPAKRTVRAKVGKRFKDAVQ